MSKQYSESLNYHINAQDLVHLCDLINNQFENFKIKICVYSKNLEFIFDNVDEFKTFLNNTEIKVLDKVSIRSTDLTELLAVKLENSVNSVYLNYYGSNSKNLNLLSHILQFLKTRRSYTRMYGYGFITLMFILLFNIIYFGIPDATTVELLVAKTSFMLIALTSYIMAIILHFHSEYYGYPFNRIFRFATIKTK